MGAEPISSWQSFEEDGKIHLDEFFLKKEDYSNIYWEAENRRAKKNPSAPVIEQLSPKGLALLSYLYAIKDGKEAQPIIASTINDFVDIVTLIDNAPIDITTTIILQPTDSEHRDFSYVHKTVFRFEKKNDYINVLHMDGTNNFKYGVLCKENIEDTLQKNAYALKRNKTRLNFYFQNNVANNKNYSRQVDKYQCGIFAIKDARQLNRETDVSISKQFNFFEDKYHLPSQYLKSIQSNTHYNDILQEHGQKIVTKKGETLEQIHTKHEPFGYVQHFSEKYKKEVENFFHQNVENPELIKSVVELYDAGSLTMERLVNVYGNKNLEKINNETVTHINKQFSLSSF